MLVGIISDIHGNLCALEAVLERLEREGADEVWCLGDIVGYGPEPNECIEIISRKSSLCVRGNHEVGVLCESAALGFNWAARAACEWTRERLGAAELGFISSLPVSKERPEEKTILMHGEPLFPELFEYISCFEDMKRSVESLPGEWICFVGHSHTAYVYGEEAGLQKAAENRKIKIKKGERAIVNVGSVGQPRDGDFRSCWVLWDTEERTVRFRRTWYDVDRTVASLTKAGLPSVLGERLRYGR